MNPLGCKFLISPTIVTLTEESGRWHRGNGAGEWTLPRDSERVPKSATITRTGDWRIGKEFADALGML